ncbi:MAG: DUF4097 family beta strand repeat protein [Phycisphaerales bacterium]|nr:DUF4097 family beta strand repeat protein [Phycisphaerales bacterium]
MTDVETGQAESVLVQTEAGDVELIATDGPATVEAHVYAQTEERADATRIRAVVSNEGRLEISIDWPGGERRDSESCDIVARLPRMDGVWVRTGAGEIEVEGMAGEMLVETGAGDIDVDRHDGKVTAVTAAGDIEIEDTTGPISATTRAGDVDLERVRGTIDARTSAGDIHAMIVGPYSGTIVAKTAVGDLRVMGREYHEKHATVALGDGPEISTFESSVGDVLVRITDN